MLINLEQTFRASSVYAAVNESSRMILMGEQYFYLDGCAMCYGLRLIWHDVLVTPSCSPIKIFTTLTVHRARVHMFRCARAIDPNQTTSLIREYKRIPSLVGVPSASLTVAPGWSQESAGCNHEPRWDTIEDSKPSFIRLSVVLVNRPLRGPRTVALSTAGRLSSQLAML